MTHFHRHRRPCATAVQLNYRCPSFFAFPESCAPVMSKTCFQHGARSLSGNFTTQNLTPIQGYLSKASSGEGPGSPPREVRGCGRESGGVPQKSMQLMSKSETTAAMTDQRASLNKVQVEEIAQLLDSIAAGGGLSPNLTGRELILIEQSKADFAAGSIYSLGEARTLTDQFL